MAAALRAAEGGGYIFSKSSGGYFQNFSGQGGYTPLPPPIPDPCLIPKGSTIFYHIDNWMRSKKLWNNPELFNPNRFLSDGKYFVPTKAFFPFGFGTQRCPGERLAMAHLFITLTIFIQKTINMSIKLKVWLDDYLLPDRHGQKGGGQQKPPCQI